MKLVPENINEAIKHLSPRSDNEINKAVAAQLNEIPDKKYIKSILKKLDKLNIKYNVQFSYGVVIISLADRCWIRCQYDLDIHRPNSKSFWICWFCWFTNKGRDAGQCTIEELLSKLDYLVKKPSDKWTALGFKRFNVNETVYGSRKDVFTNKNNPRIVITVHKGPDGRIGAIDNPQRVRFPFLLGQIMSRNIETWACNNNFLINGEDPCPEQKIFGVKASQVPQGHEWRRIFPNKFR